MTYEQELQELEKKAADKKRELEARYRVLHHLGTVIARLRKRILGREYSDYYGDDRNIP